MAAPATNVRLAEHRKLITTTGGFWADGKLLGKGTWKAGGRFTVLVNDWGSIWWVGILTTGGMYTASPKTEDEANTIKPTTLEKFSGPDPEAPAGGSVRLHEQKKLIAMTGEFYVNGELLGYGEWKAAAPSRRFVVFVAAWGNIWWVGVPTAGGMYTASPKTEAEANTIKPTNFEKFSVPAVAAPAATVALAEQNKAITPYGEFFVNGALLGMGQWNPQGRFTVLVKDWGAIWWVGVIVKGGMQTATYKTEEEAAVGVPTHFEAYGGAGGEPAAPN